MAGQLGLKVLLIDHYAKVGEKIRISGGGRCNFTNRDLDASAPQRHFLGANPVFCRSALSRYTAQDFIDLVKRHGVPFHEKHKGQMFGDRSAEDFIAMLLSECAAGAVTRWQPCRVQAVRAIGDDAGARYELDSERGTVRSRSLVVASGGLSIPKIGASDFGHRLARQFDLRVVEPRPALVPLTFDDAAWQAFAALAGVALAVDIGTGSGKSRMAFSEDLLFTHKGLSGPAVLQISSYWQPGTPIRIDLAPGQDLRAALRHAKSQSRKLIANVLSEASQGMLPARLAAAWVQRDAAWLRPVNEASDKALDALAQSLSQWEITPGGTEGYRKAEVTAGGVDTRDLSSQTMESKQAGLYFIGEVVDVTGWLGGYNFQWAWSSAYACAQSMAVHRN